MSPVRPVRGGRPYLGYRGGDFDTPFAKYFDPVPTPLSEEVREALVVGAQAPACFADVAEAGRLLDAGPAAVENGYARCSDHSVRVAVRTEMPGVTPAMWDWWFGWHGCDARRYKLWNPGAHLWAQWADGPDAGRRGRARYVGRTSFVDEYLGSTLVRAAISFIEPARLGLDGAALAEGGDQTVVCARVGSSDVPLDLGYLVHHVRAVEGGAQMRSRFWLGGPHVGVRTGGAAAGRLVAAGGRLAFRPSARSAAELLAHCAQEMSHLARFLPRLYAEFADE